MNDQITIADLIGDRQARTLKNLKVDLSTPNGGQFFKDCGFKKNDRIRFTGCAPMRGTGTILGWYKENGYLLFYIKVDGVKYIKDKSKTAAFTKQRQGLVTKEGLPPFTARLKDIEKIA